MECEIILDRYNHTYNLSVTINKDQYRNKNNRVARPKE